MTATIRTPLAGAACAALALAGAVPAHAADDGRAAGLRGVPAPRFQPDTLYPVPLRLELRLDAALVHDPVADAQAAVDARPEEPAARQRLRGLSRSFVRLGGRETLDAGWSAQFRLEHSLRPDDGGPLDPARFWDAEATVGLAHARGWLLELGRREQPAWGVVLRADPWAGNGVASPDRWLYAPRLGPGRDADGAPLPSAALERRSDASATLTVPWQWPGRAAWALQLHGGRPGPGDASHGGASLRYEAGGWYAGLGHQSWPGGARATPIALARVFDVVELSAAVTRGRGRDGTGALNAYTGALLAVRGEAFAAGAPRRHEWRAGLGALHIEDGPRQWKLGAGYRYHFSRGTALQFDLARVRAADWGAGGALRGHWAVDAGLVVGLARELREPQLPR